ncbi:MAG: DNA-directed RNA polymerase subunit alpha [Chloroflexota bacterium]
MIETLVPRVTCVETTENYGRFVAEPVDKGCGITLGNALRRVLLSSLQGAAITWIKIEGVHHEFSTIPNVKEDVIDFILNVKSLRLHSLTGQAGRLYLEAQGEHKVHAGDIQPSTDFEIVNPESLLANLDSPDAKLIVEFNVDVGRSYLSAGSAESLPIGAIPVDAIFTPVRKVNYSVEPVHVGREASPDRVILEIWTDKTMSPVEALQQSAAFLVQQFSCFQRMAEGKELPWQLNLTPDQYNMAIEDLGLPTRVANSLKRSRINTLGQVMEKGTAGLETVSGFGEKGMQEVEETLTKLGLILPAKDVSK